MWEADFRLGTVSTLFTPLWCILYVLWEPDSPSGRPLLTDRDQTRAIFRLIRLKT